MEAVQLGRSGLRVSPLCLGTMTFGNETTESDAKAIADRAVDAGMFFWDTSDMYGGGKSEEIVGRLMLGRREQVVIATKAFAKMGPGANDGGLSAKHLIAACEASLQRLQTDWIDLYYLHLPDRTVPIEETLRAIEDLTRAGKIRYAACSNYFTWEVMDLLGCAERHNHQAITAVQPVYNLVNRDIEVEMLPMCAAKGLGVVSYSPLARGVLTGKYQWHDSAPDESRLSRSNKRFLQAEWRAESVAVAAELAKLAEQRGCTAAELAMAWALANQNVHSVIAGPRTMAHLESYLQASAFHWDDELEAACDALVPPGTHSGVAFPDPAYYPVTGRVTR
jgi:aryl-alcohol dehydrogenase-like predicted oxidoreductase